MSGVIALAGSVPWESVDALRGRAAAAGAEGAGGAGGAAALLLVAIGAVAAAVVAAIVVSVIRRDRRRHGPACRRLARALGLGFREQRLVGRCARAQGLETAASMLIGRGCFDHALAHHTARYGADPRLERVRALVHGPIGPAQPARRDRGAALRGSAAT